MHNRNGRTSADEAVEHKSKGILNQVKGNVKEAFGAVTGDHSTRREGTRDRLKGRVQEAYGDVKEKQARLEEDLDDIDRGKL